MNFSVYIILFTVLSFVGFLMDSAHRSIVERKFVKSGYVPYLPLCPVYGFGGLAIYVFQRDFGYLPISVLVLAGLVLALLTEYVGGIYCVRCIKERLWDYSKLKWNLNGHISFSYAIYWVVVVFIFVKYLFPVFLSLETWLRKNVILTNFEELLFLGFAIFVFVLVSYIEFRKRQALKKMKGML